jgi:hypothetical protein
MVGALSACLLYGFNYSKKHNNTPLVFLCGFGLVFTLGLTLLWFFVLIVYGVRT